MAETLPDQSGLSGNIVRGLADTGQDTAQSASGADFHIVEDALANAADLVGQSMDMAGRAISHGVEAASTAAFESAANVGPNIAAPQSTFSWGGYLQAIGVLCFLLAALWFAVWLIRRYGKFNFLPRPGSLPKDALVMEAQLPIGPKKGLMVVRFLDKRLLLGVSDQQITLLAEANTANESHENSYAMDSHGNPGADDFHS